jgi:polyferredoxin
MRRINVIGLCVAALLIHIILPLIFRNREIYYVIMPLPWSTTGLQLLDSTSSFYERKNILWGAAGISATIIVFVAVNVFVFIGTLLFGRRLQCSTLCLMNGFVAEIWSPVLPLAGKRKGQKAILGNRARLALNTARISMFAISSLFTLWWILKISGIHVPFKSHGSLMGTVESFKYLTLELLMAMFFWVAWSGRGYCHYCPAGTALSIIAKLGGQRIRTDCAPCVSCGLCSKACPLSIDIASSAAQGKTVKSMNCVGCGHCVDACPSGVLKYETNFLRFINKQ